MRSAYRAAQVKAAEGLLMPTLPPGTLMMRAAFALARRCALTLGRVYGSRVVVLVGSGDNGGDALYAGAFLAARGAAVSARLTDPGRVHAEGLSSFLASGGRIIDGYPQKADLIIDGLVGIGATGPLRGPAVSFLDGMPPAPVVAVDIPSGVDVDTGDVPGPAIRADVTVTFGCLKPALVIGPAVAHAGQVELVDIGLQPYLRGGAALHLADAEDIAAWWPRPDLDSDKYTRGVVGLATGSAQYPGAALLSVAGALAGPSGLVRYAGGAHRLVVAHHPSVVVAQRVAEASRVQAWVCGCGLGTESHAAAELRAVLGSPVPAVLDADALTLLVDGSMASELRRRDAPTVLTPHDREFARLAGELPGEDRVAAALKLAAWTNSTVLLKGYRTVVASPAGQAWVNTTGVAELATGGTGDVLAGLLGSLLATGLPPWRAAVMAAYVHGQAARFAAESGPVTAVEVAEALRLAIATTIAAP
ncbi:MAG TPA: NAD(P)H-hydrate dehydratase, partial [Candidatus Limnocylindrales bacterium]